MTEAFFLLQELWTRPISTAKYYGGMFQLKIPEELDRFLTPWTWDIKAPSARRYQVAKQFESEALQVLLLCELLANPSVAGSVSGASKACVLILRI
jgi:hypothetical protein